MDQKQRAFQFVDDRREEMLSLWREVVGIQSGPHEKAGIDRVAGRFWRPPLAKSRLPLRAADSIRMLCKEGKQPRLFTITSRFFLT